MTTLSDKFVEIMADYSATAFWDSDGCNVDWDDVPVSDNLKAELIEWVRVYNIESLDEGYSTNLKFDLEYFSEWGKNLAQCVKAELPDWTVRYFDERLIDVIQDEDHLLERSQRCRYEIKSK